MRKHIDLEYFLQKNEKYVLVSIFFIALLFRILNLIQIKSNDPFFSLPSVDPLIYHRWAIDIINGNFLGKEVFFNSPLYPYFLALIYYIFGESFFFAKFIQSLIGSLNCILVYLIAKKVSGNLKVAAISGTISALYVMFVFIEGIYLIENIQIPLVLLLVLSLLRTFESPSRKNMFFSGSCLGLAALAKPNILLLIPFIFFWLICFLNKHLTKRRVIEFGFLLSLGIGLLIIPVTLRNYIVEKDLVLINSNGGINFYIGNNEHALGRFMVPKEFLYIEGKDPISQKANFGAFAERELGKKLKPSEISRFWYARGIAFIRKAPLKWLKLIIMKLRLFINYYEFSNNRSYYVSRQFSWVLRCLPFSYNFILPFALLGMILALKEFKKFFFLYALVWVYTLSSLIFYVISRYRMPVVPIFIIFASYGIVQLLDSIKKRQRRMMIYLFSLIIFFIIVNQKVLDTNLYVEYYNLGNKYNTLQKWEQAIEQYKKSIKLNPTYISTHNNLAMVYEKDPNWHHDAIEEWKIVLRMGKELNLPHYVDRAERHLENLIHH